MSEKWTTGDTSPCGKFIIASENYAGAHGDRMHILLEWSPAKHMWLTASIPGNDCMAEKRSLRSLYNRTRTK